MRALLTTGAPARLRRCIVAFLPFLEVREGDDDPNDDSAGMQTVDDGYNSISVTFDDSESPLPQRKSAGDKTNEQLEEEGEQFVKRRLSIANYGGSGGLGMDA